MQSQQFPNTALKIQIGIDVTFFRYLKSLCATRFWILYVGIFIEARLSLITLFIFIEN